jgi:hypothetical protein
MGKRDFLMPVDPGALRSRISVALFVNVLVIGVLLRVVAGGIAAAALSLWRFHVPLVPLFGALLGAYLFAILRRIAAKTGGSSPLWDLAVTLVAVVGGLGIDHLLGR